MFTLKLKSKFTLLLKLLYASLKVMVKVCFYIKFQSYDLNRKYHSKLLSYFNATINFGITWPESECLESVSMEQLL